MRLLKNIFRESFPSRPKWNVDDIPNLAGKIAIVTGGNTGIGRETVRALLKHDAKVYMASRNQELSEAAINELESDTGKRAFFLKLDLSSFQSVRRAAEEFLSKEHELHILFNNAGVFFTKDKKLLSAERYDFIFATNVIGHHLFTKLLMPSLFAAYESSNPKSKSRIITTSSMGNYFGKLNYETFVDSPARDAASQLDLYSQSKLANAVVAHELAQRFGDKGILSIAVNPGNIRTDLYRAADSTFNFFLSSSLYPLEYGAISQLWAGTAPEADECNGMYAYPWARVCPLLPSVADPVVGKKLWDWLEEQTPL